MTNSLALFSALFQLRELIHCRTFNTKGSTTVTIARIDTVRIIMSQETDDDLVSFIF